MGGGRVILLKNQPAIALLTQEIILLPRRRVAPNVNVVLGWGQPEGAPMRELTQPKDEFSWSSFEKPS